MDHFNQHAQSNMHKETLLKIELSKQTPINALMDKEVKKAQETHKDMLLVVLDSLRCLLRQGLAIRGHQEIEGNLMQLLLLQANRCDKLKQYIKDSRYLSNTVIDEMMGYMGMAVLDEFLAEIREAGMFAIIADETTDVSHKEQLCVSIRWVDHDFEIYETPIQLIHITKTDPEQFLLQYWNA